MGNLKALLIILAAFLAAYWLRFGLIPVVPGYLLALMTGLVLSTLIIPATGAFRREFRWETTRRLRRMLAGWLVVVIAMITVAALLKLTATYSRIWFGSWVLFTCAGFALEQGLAHLWNTRFTTGAQRRLVLVGSGDAARAVEERLATQAHPDFEVVARFGESWSGHSTRPAWELEKFVADHDVDDIWIAYPLSDARGLHEALEQLKNSLVEVHVIPDLDQYRMLNQGVSEWAGLPIISLSGTPMSGGELKLKTVGDRVIATLLLLAFSPLMLLIAALIKLEGRGPLLFSQPRHGIGGEIIRILKFRSMVYRKEPENGLKQARPQDERVTWVGRLLRRSSLDELPQLFNVVKGEMSLVGPRPHPLELNHLFQDRIPRYLLRHRVRPGMTGWAQINGFRGITDTEDKMLLRIEHDLWYIQNWSLWLDLKILLRTPFAMFGKNAY